MIKSVWNDLGEGQTPDLLLWNGKQIN